MKREAVTIRFPAPLPAEISCPVCITEDGKRGGGCKACEYKAKITVTVDAKIPIQRGHIIKYVSENLSVVASELTRVTGLVPEVQTKEVLDSEEGQYEIVQISSLGGAIWIANRLDDFESPRYFYSITEVKNFKQGVSI
tara:strand:- start:4021 stop:4437 length:417 start_codon:yes stop_codon:yes gene_type:complete